MAEERQRRPETPAEANGAAAVFVVFPKDPQVAYAEVQGFPRLITDGEEVRKIADRYGTMRATALSPTESRALIEKKLESL